jgi:hypothetical protein
MWDVRCGMWDVGCKMWSRRARRPRPSSSYIRNLTTDLVPCSGCDAAEAGLSKRAVSEAMESPENYRVFFLKIAIPRSVI